MPRPVGERERRIAENETRFRAANEDLREEWRERELPLDRDALFICECGDPRCTEVVRLTLREYESVRADANTFFVLPGHHDRPTERVVTDAVVERNDRFAVVQKRPENRAATEGTDPRAA
jgi:hypothetical protein